MAQYTQSLRKSLDKQNLKQYLKLNLGCGTDIRKGYINLDSAKLKGVDIVWNLDKYPWPFKNNQFEEIFAQDVLEHLSDKIKPVEELWRIAKPGAKIIVQVPNWNVEGLWVDPTHKQSYTNRSFDFFDVDSLKTKDRFYVSHARFRVVSKSFYVNVFGFTLLIKNPFLRVPVSWIAQYLSGILVAIIFELKVVK